MVSIPDRWLNYKPIGTPIPGTRIVAFKCPLELNENSKVPDENRLTPKLLLELIPKLGLVIDLTNTRRYYQPNLFIVEGVEYTKLFIEGHHIPTKENRLKFHNTVLKFLTQNYENDKLIGVHCTHGVNRTGIMICDYLIRQCKWNADEAMTKFGLARGHCIERQNYIEYLNDLMTTHMEEQRDEIAQDDDNNKGSQTDNTFVIDSYVVRKKRFNSRPSENGLIRVNKSNLIPDGKGNFFVHVRLSDIEPERHMERQHRYNDHYNNYQHYSRPGNSIRQRVQNASSTSSMPREDARMKYTWQKYNE